MQCLNESIVTETILQQFIGGKNILLYTKEHKVIIFIMKSRVYLLSIEYQCQITRK